MPQAAAPRNAQTHQGCGPLPRQAQTVWQLNSPRRARRCSDVAPRHAQTCQGVGSLPRQAQTV
eukprot:1150220-Pelagomonas_calceolata.AAC.3